MPHYYPAIPWRDCLTIPRAVAIAVSGLSGTFIDEAIHIGALRTTKPGKQRLIYVASLVKLIKEAETRQLNVRGRYAQRLAEQKAATEQPPAEAVATKRPRGRPRKHALPASLAEPA